MSVFTEMFRYCSHECGVPLYMKRTDGVNLIVLNLHIGKIRSE